MIFEKNKSRIKIKESCLKIQERDILDQVKNIDSENNKSGLIIGFIGTILVFGFKDLDKNNIYQLVFLIIVSILPIITALNNMYSKKVYYHQNINSFFISKTNDYENFLNEIHLANQTVYKNITELLTQKANGTKISYILTVILLIYTLFIKLYG